MSITVLSLLLTLAAPAADEPSSQPKLVPVTRPEMKQALEALKKRQPRLPLPPLTDEERALAGDRPVVNNGRMHALYLPPELVGRGGSRGADPAQTLDPTFKTRLFWIVSRANNCQYCLGHQELKLSVAGMTDDQLAALDVDWDAFPAAEHAAFEFTRRLTYMPHTLDDAAINKLRPYYKDRQILEIIFTVAGNNATNRWTDSLGIPEDADGSFFARNNPKAPKKDYSTFLSPTADAFKNRPSRVAPLSRIAAGATAAPPCAAERPALESREQVEAALAKCRQRTSRIPLVDEAKARAALPADWPKGPLPQWVRLLTNFPKAGTGRIISLRAAEEKGSLSPRLKAQTAWIAARQDRAWYAVGRAKRRLIALGVMEDDIYALDKGESAFTPAEKTAFAFVRKLTATPYLIADKDVADLRKHYSDKEVAELVLHIGNAAFFDRVTEASGLRLEDR
jgi:AhpD family alkylhydroperoxidase